MKNHRPVPTRGKKLTTDHPPIHPTGAATREQLGDDVFRIYELVLRRFLATLAPDATWKTMKILFVAGGEEYTTTGRPADRTRLAHGLPVQRGKGSDPARVCHR